MKYITSFLFTIASVFISTISIGQSNWKLVKNEDGIKVYQASSPKSNYKKIKVEATMPGTINKLYGILTNVPNYKEWVYSNNGGHIIKRISPYDFYFYSELDVPWPATDRDAVAHMKIERDKDNKYLKVLEVGEPKFLPEKPGKVRVPKSILTWNVTAINPTTLSIVYTIEADPGGEVPAWLVNTFSEKGPFETFKGLKKQLKK